MNLSLYALLSHFSILWVHLICHVLDCRIEDVVEIIDDTEQEKNQ